MDIDISLTKSQSVDGTPNATTNFKVLITREHSYHNMSNPVLSTGSAEDEGNFQKSKKRPRVSGIADLSDDLIGKVFKFLGHGHFFCSLRELYRVYETI